jgi:tetratricopeptide (TPR) repeat protein
VPEINDLFRAARLRVESPSAPGTPMTRQELAEAVNAHSYRTAGKLTAVDANHVGKWERGTIQWPAAHYRSALRAVLSVATDAELGFRRSPRGTTDGVDRKTFLKTTLGASVGAWLSGNGGTVERNDLAAALSGPTAHYRRIEAAVASNQLGPAVDAHLTLVTKIATTKLRTSAGFAVLAETAGLAAWLAVDRGDHATARRRYGEAIAHAQRAHHPLLAAYMTASFGHYAVEVGHPRHGLTLLNRAAAQLGPTAPNAAHAWLSSLHAVAHAALRDRAATIASLQTAEKLASRPPSEPQWPWVFAFDAPKAARYQATALGQLGDLRSARSAYETAAPALAAPKPRALAQIEHAQVLANAGLVDDACRLAMQALTVAHTYGSERIITRVREFRASLRSRTTAARELDDALAALFHADRQ